MTDLISRADAIEAVCKLQKYDFDERNRLRIYAPWHGAKRIFVETEAIYKTIYTLPSADAVPTVIRAKTFMRKEDFDKWAEDIKKQNQNIVCIPCDAEVVSADADTDDLIIKGANGIQDGLYNIKDGKLFKYKAKGGTVRTYPIIKL